MSPEELLKKAQVLVALWRTRRYDQLAAVGVIAGAAAFVWVLTGKTPIPLSTSYRTIALVTFGCFTAGCALFLLISISRIQDPDATTAVIQALPSSVRGPLPFTEKDGDLFRKLGRDYLIAQSLAYVTNDQIPVVLVSGESGVGKTSLLRAGLTGPMKEGYGRCVIYWEAKPSNAWEGLTATVKDGLGDPTLTSLDELFQKRPQVRPVIMIDQLEQLSRSNEAHLPIYELIARAAQGGAPHPATWIIAFRRDFVGIYEFLAEKGIAVPFILVPPFSRDQAEQVMASLAERAGVRFERQLLKDFTASAAMNGAVSSVDIGIGTLVLVNLAKRSKKDTITLDDYKFAGGSSGVLTTYVKDQLSTYPDVWQEGILKALLALIDLDKNQRIAEGRSASALAAESNIARSRLAANLNALAAPQIRILEKLEGAGDDDPVFRLPHERFIQPIRTLAGSMLAKENLAQVMLDSGYTAWLRSRDPRMLLSGRELKQVHQIVAQRAGVFSPDVLDYVRRSQRRGQVTIAKRIGVGSIALLLLGGLGLRVRSVPQIIADTRPHKNGSVEKTVFQELGLILTEEGGDPKTKSGGGSLWRARDAQRLLEVPGTLRAVCQDPPLVLLTDSNSRASIFNVQRMDFAPLDTSIPEGEAPTFVESCKYFGYSHLEKGKPNAADRIESLHFWQTATGKPIPVSGTFVAPEIGWFLPNVDPSKSFLLQGIKFVERTASGATLRSLATNAIVATLSRHHRAGAYTIDGNHLIFAFAESAPDGKGAEIEFWSLRDGSLLRSWNVQDAVVAIGFLVGGSLFAYERPNGSVELLQVSDLTLSQLLGGTWNQVQLGLDVNGFQVGKDVLALDLSSDKSFRFMALKGETVDSTVIDNSWKAAIVLNKDGTLIVCADSRPCSQVTSGISSLGHTVGNEMVYAVEKRDNTLELFDYTGKKYVSGLYGDWSNIDTVSYNPGCEDFFAWPDSGDLVRYRKKWTIFGYPIANVHLGCGK